MKLLKYDVDTRKDSLYMVYHNMLRRCYKNTHNSKYYKDKGIRVCDDWKKDYQNFKKWALDNGYQKGLAIDRIDSNSNYEPSNCRFITISENSSRIKRKKGVFCLNDLQKQEIYYKKANGYKLKDLALEYNVSLSTIKKLLYKEMRDR